jgi:uncharacterized membrane protein YkgB
MLEVVLAVGLLAGFRLPMFAFASGVLLLAFAVNMTVALGTQPPLSSSVWTAAAGAFVLASFRLTTCGNGTAGQDRPSPGV